MAGNKKPGNRVFNAALVGFGNRGDEHVDALELDPCSIEIKAVCDVDDSARERARQRLPGVKTGADLSALLAETNCELIVICLPPEVELRSIVEAVRKAPSAKAVLLEKPAANRVSVAEQIFCDFPIPVFLFHQMRFLPWAREAREWFQERAESHSLSASINAYCYGKFLDQGLHILDLVSWIVGGLPEGIRHVVAEHDPARISSQHPLPFEWRLDHSHAGPTILEVDASWRNGPGFSLKTGPHAADGWLGKGIRISFGEGDWLEFGPLVLREGSGDRESMAKKATVEDYQRASALVYQSVERWLSGEIEDVGLPGISEHIQHLKYYESVLTFEKIERLPAPHWLGRDEDEPPVLVVIPLSDHRGVAEDCIRSWTHDQDCSADDYEVVVISNLDTKAIGGSIRGLLRPHDRLIETNQPTAELGQGDMDEYVLGIESSESEWIFLTEPHCEAHPNTVSEIRHYFSTSEAAGFCTSCEDYVDAPWGQMEAYYSAEGFTEAKQEGHWCKMIMRGFGIRRTAYKLAGGFRLRYGRFSEWLLAADLHRRGLYLGYAEKVSLTHHYTLTQPYLVEAIEEFVIGQAQYTQEAPRSERLPYFPDPPVDSSIPPSLDRLFRSAGSLQGWFSGWREKWIQPVRVREARREWNGFLVRIFARWLPAIAYPFFKAYYHSQIEACLIKHQADQSDVTDTKLKVGDEWAASSDGFEALIEIHQREVWHDVPFHWSKPIFAIPVDFSSSSGGGVTLQVKLLELRKIERRTIHLICSWDPENPLSPAEKTKGDEVELTFEIQRGVSREVENGSGEDWLVVSAPTLKGDPLESRSLGLPLFSVSLHEGKKSS